MDIFQILSFLAYLLGMIGWLFVWRLYNGYELMNQQKIIHLPFWGAHLTFLANAILVPFSPIPDYTVELKVYEYVEINARTIATLALAIAVFAYFISQSKKTPEQSTNTKIPTYFLICIMWGFLFAIIGVLPIYWMPPVYGWLTVLRHIKSVFYFFSLFTVATAIVIFMYELGVLQKTNQSSPPQ